MQDADARIILGGEASGPVLATSEPLSFWGGVDPSTGWVIDVHHPLNGRSLAGTVLMMPSTRGSCTGSGVLLDLALNGLAPAALIFSQAEDVVTLGALIASRMFGKSVPVVKVSPALFERLSQEASISVTSEAIVAAGAAFPLSAAEDAQISLTERDRALLSGAEGEAPRLAMEIILAMAGNQGAAGLVDVVQGHIDGCIYASPANLTFAEAMASMGARVSIPTTMNAISVDHDNWRGQGMPESFGAPAARLADAYVKMGCRNTFTCSPYLLETAPSEGDRIAWAESNAVIYANSVLGARTAKHPDFLDLLIAITGRSPLSGVYLDENRQATRVLDIEAPAVVDDAFWPLVGYLAGKASPDRIPLLRGLARLRPDTENLKALCAAFGTTSASPMLHVEGITPEAHRLSPDADCIRMTLEDMKEGWTTLNAGPDRIDLVAIGSPHASLAECRAFLDALGGRSVSVATIITAGRQVIAEALKDGTLASLDRAQVRVLPDLCWCSISEPVFPPAARTLMTNSGKYAHYGPGLSGRAVRFGSLADCASAAISGTAEHRLPEWLGGAAGEYSMQHRTARVGEGN